MALHVISLWLFLNAVSVVLLCSAKLHDENVCFSHDTYFVDNDLPPKCSTTTFTHSKTTTTSVPTTTGTTTRSTTTITTQTTTQAVTTSSSTLDRTTTALELDGFVDEDNYTNESSFELERKLDEVIAVLDNVSANASDDTVEEAVGRCCEKWAWENEDRCIETNGGVGFCSESKPNCEGNCNGIWSDTKACADTLLWTNPLGLGCSGYAASGFCADGSVALGKEWTLGPGFGDPEDNCCVCGKRKQLGEATATTSTKTTTSTTTSTRSLLVLDNDTVSTSPEFGTNATTTTTTSARSVKTAAATTTLNLRYSCSLPDCWLQPFDRSRCAVIAAGDTCELPALSNPCVEERGGVILKCPAENERVDQPPDIFSGRLPLLRCKACGIWHRLVDTNGRGNYIRGTIRFGPVVHEQLQFDPNISSYRIFLVDASARKRYPALAEVESSAEVSTECCNERAYSALVEIETVPGFDRLMVVPVAAGWELPVGALTSPLVDLDFDRDVYQLVGTIELRVLKQQLLSQRSAMRRAVSLGIAKAIDMPFELVEVTFLPGSMFAPDEDLAVKPSNGSRRLVVDATGVNATLSARYSITLVTQSLADDVISSLQNVNVRQITDDIIAEIPNSMLALQVDALTVPDRAGIVFPSTTSLTSVTMTETTSTTTATIVSTTRVTSITTTTSSSAASGVVEIAETTTSSTTTTRTRTTQTTITRTSSTTVNRQAESGDRYSSMGSSEEEGMTTAIIIAAVAIFGGLLLMVLCFLGLRWKRQAQSMSLPKPDLTWRPRWRRSKNQKDDSKTMTEEVSNPCPPKSALKDEMRQDEGKKPVHIPTDTVKSMHVIDQNLPPNYHLSKSQDFKEGDYVTANMTDERFKKLKLCAADPRGKVQKVDNDGALWVQFSGLPSPEKVNRTEVRKHQDAPAEVVLDVTPAAAAQRVGGTATGSSSVVNDTLQDSSTAPVSENARVEAEYLKCLAEAVAAIGAVEDTKPSVVEEAKPSAVESVFYVAAQAPSACEADILRSIEMYASAQRGDDGLPDPPPLLLPNDNDAEFRCPAIQGVEDVATQPQEPDTIMEVIKLGPPSTPQPSVQDMKTFLLGACCSGCPERISDGSACEIVQLTPRRDLS